MAKENQLYKISGAHLKELWILAMKYAEDFTIQHAGITKNFAVVTTKECVDFQKKEGNLLVHFDGHWKVVYTPDFILPNDIKPGSRWKQVIPTEVIWT